MIAYTFGVGVPEEGMVVLASGTATLSVAHGAVDDVHVVEGSNTSGSTNSDVPDVSAVQSEERQVSLVYPK